MIAKNLFFILVSDIQLALHWNQEVKRSPLLWHGDKYMLSANPSVFMIGWEYPPYNSGGLGVACDGLTRALSNAGNQIYFTLPYKYPGLLSHLQLIDCHDSSYSEFDKAPFFAYNSPALSSALTIEEIAKGIDSLPQSEIEMRVDAYAQIVSRKAKKYQANYDLIHAHDWMSFPAAVKLQKKTGKPMITHIHSTEFDRIPSGSGSNFIKQTEYEGMQSADLIIAVSHYTKQVLVSKYGIDPSKIEVVHNGVDPLEQSSVDLLHFAPQRPLVVFMGRLTMQKGAEYFIDLASSVLEELPDALFVLAGSGDQFRSLLFKAAGSRLSASVLFSGFLRGREKEILLSRADVFIMPSVSEPFGLVALEAAQRGIPVIVSKSSGVSEVLSGAVLVDFWDINKMKAQILKLIDNEKYSQAVIKEQNKSLEGISWKNAANKLRSLYQGILKR